MHNFRGMLVSRPECSLRLLNNDIVVKSVWKTIPALLETKTVKGM